MVIELDIEYKKRKQEIEEIINKVLEKHQISLSETTIENLIIHLSLCISREMSGSYIPTSESQIKNLKAHEYYPVAKDIIHSLEEFYNILIDKNQMSYTTMYLANMNLLDIDFNFEFDLDEDIMEQIISETIINIHNELSLDLRKNKEFYTGMTLHFFPALERLKDDNQLTDNPLVDYIQAKHEEEFKCAKIFNRVVEKYYDKSFNNHELAYISLHFGTAMRAID